MKNKSDKKNQIEIRRFTSLRLVVLFFAFYYTSFGFLLSAQETKIMLKIKEKPLSDVLNQLEVKTGYIFLVSSNDINLKELVTIDVVNKNLVEILTILFEKNKINFEITGKSISIFKTQKLKNDSPTSIPKSTRKVSGIVLDEKADPIIGANVMISGTDNGSVTDINGHFTLEAPTNAKLRISYIGYDTKLIELSANSDVRVSLEQTSKKLDEVVVVGYGTVKKRDLTGAVTSLKQDVFEQSGQSSFVNNMQGRVAGLQITTGSGEPGSGSKVVIRGANTLAGSSDPLYVIDGIQVNESEAPIANSKFGANSQRNPLSSINPADIVSVEILKDASSTAIYGSKGANGVILITTRQGKEGAPVISYDGRFGVSYSAKKLEMLNGDEWLDYRKDWTLMPDKKRIIYGYFNDWLFFLNAGETNPSSMIPRDVYALPEYDWQNEMYRTANTTSHTLSISGGTKFTKYAGSVGYNNEEGILKNNGYTRYNTRLKLDHNKDRFIMSLSLNASYSKYYGASQSGDGYSNIGVTQSAIVSRPLVFVNPDDEVNLGGWKKPTENLKYISRDISTPNVSSNLMLNYKIREGLYIATTVSGTIVNSKCNEFYGKGTPWGYYLKGRAAITNVEWMGWSNINTLYYSLDFKNNTKLNLLGVFELNGSGYQNSSITISNFPDESTGINDISKGITFQGATSGAVTSNRVSYMGRLNYDMFGKYLLTGSMRADGSDRFGANNRFGYFPSLALAWRITEEPFMKNQKIIDNLKLRLSYGQTGNSNIPEFQYMARMGNSFYGDQLGLVPASLPNPDLKWETTIQYNMGLDLSILKGRVDLTLDIYDKITTDMLYQAIIPAQSGFKTQWQNLGKVDNRGIEIGLNTKNIVTRDFSWTTNFTFSTNKNKVITIGNGLDMAPIGAGSWSLSYIKLNVVGRIMENQPIGVMYGYKMDGIYQLNDFSGWVDKTGQLQPNDPSIHWEQRGWILKSGVTDCSALANLRPGTFKFKNLDNSADNKITESDKTIIGNSQPLFFGGIGNNFQYKGFELSLFLNYSFGNDIFNSTKFELEGSSGEYYNITKNFWNHRWTPENPTNEYPSYSDVNYYNSLAAQPNSYYIEDASFLRLQTISFSYTLPHTLVKKARLNNVKFYYSGNNIFTWTKYSGFTPEVNSGNALLTNFDTIGYPRSTSHSFGVSLTF